LGGGDLAARILGEHFLNLSPCITKGRRNWRRIGN
jgi:hypothetical protein